MSIERRRRISELQANANRQNICSQLRELECMADSGLRVVDSEEFREIKQLALFPDGIARRGQRLFSAFGEIEWIDELIAVSMASRFWNPSVPAFLVDTSTPVVCSADLQSLLRCKCSIIEVVRNFVWIVDGSRQTVLSFGLADTNDDDFDAYEAHLLVLDQKSARVPLTE